MVMAPAPLPALRAALQQTRDAACKTRLQAVRKAREGKKRAEIAQALVGSARRVGMWIGADNAGGLEALTTKPSGRNPGPPRWETSIFDDLAAAIDKGGSWSVPRMPRWISAHRHQDIPEQPGGSRMDNLQFASKSARPPPYQGDNDRQEAFQQGAWCRAWSR